MEGVVDKSQGAEVAHLLRLAQETEHYKVVWDAEQALRFLNLFLPALNGNQQHCYKIALFARRKYAECLEKSEHILERIFVHGGKPAEQGVRNLIKLQCPVGSWMSGSTPIPTEALAVYASLKVKDAKGAAGKLVGELLRDQDKDHFPVSSLKMYIGKTNAVPNNKYGK